MVNGRNKNGNFSSPIFYMRYMSAEFWKDGTCNGSMFICFISIAVCFDQNPFPKIVWLRWVLVAVLVFQMFDETAPGKLDVIAFVTHKADQWAIFVRFENIHHTRFAYFGIVFAFCFHLCLAARTMEHFFTRVREQMSIHQQKNLNKKIWLSQNVVFSIEI